MKKKPNKSRRIDKTSAPGFPSSVVAAESRQKKTERNPNVPAVISYLRYSSSAQRSGSSVKRQLEDSQKWAESKGYRIDETLRDEGVSAFRGSNAETGALASILKRIDRNEIREGSVLIVENLDRLSRNELPKAVELFLSIINRGVKIVTLTDKYEYSRDSYDLPQLMYSVMILARGNEESKTKSHRSRDNWARRRAAAKDGALLSRTLPCWLYLDGKDTITIDKAKAAAVRYCFDLALKGYGIGGIVRKLNAEKVAAPMGGKLWYTRFVWRLFREGAPAGFKQVKQFEGKRRVVVDVIKDYYPAVVSQDVYNRVSAMVAKRANHTYGKQSIRHHNFFNGILKDENGNSFTTFYRKTANIRYLISMNAYAKRAESACYLRQDLFEQVFFETLINAFADRFVPDVNGRSEKPSTSARELDKLDKQIADIEEQLVNMADAAPLLRVLSRLVEKRQKVVEQNETEKADGILTDSAAYDESLDKLRSLLTGEADNDERVEMGGIVKQLVSGIVLKLTSADGMMRGDCHIATRLGKPIRFRFSYNNAKRLNAVAKLNSLESENY